MFVLDASVVLKWFLNEEESEIALKFREDYLAGICSLAFPDLILYEVPNALKYQKPFSLNSSIMAVGALIDLGVDIIVPTKTLIQRALEVAYKKNITYYDAAYIALAEELSYKFVTADSKLYNKTKDYMFIELLSSFF